MLRVRCAGRKGVEPAGWSSRRARWWVSRRVPVAVQPGAPAARPALDDVAVVEKAIEQRRDGGGIAQQLAPVFHRPVLCGGECNAGHRVL